VAERHAAARQLEALRKAARRNARDAGKFDEMGIRCVQGRAVDSGAKQPYTRLLSHLL